jgi:hypothetical protein
MLGDCYKSPYRLEPLTAVRERGHQDPVFSYFLLRWGEEWPQWESEVQIQRVIQRSMVVRVGAE